MNVKFTIQSGTGSYPSSGSVVCSPDRSTSDYKLYSLSTSIDGTSGTYRYARTSATTARVLTSAAVTETIDLTFESGVAGRFSLNSTLGSQTGIFQVFPKAGVVSDPAPSDPRQLVLSCTVSDGTGSFGPQGSFVLSCSSDGTEYLIRGDRTNVRDSSGRLTYGKSGAAAAALTLADAGGASTCQLTFTGTNAGSFRILGPTGTQNGTFEVIYAPAFKPTRIQIASDRALWEGEAFSFETFEVSSEPCTVAWYNEGDTTPLSASPVLKFGSLRMSDSGRYRYEAVSALGSVSYSVSLTVVPAQPHAFAWARPEPFNLPLSGLFGSADFKRLFIFGGRGAIASSLDGNTWTRVSSPTTNILLSGTGSPTGLVITGNYGTILTSADGVQWSRAESPTISHLRGSAYGNGSFVAVGDNGTILSSANGRSWTVQVSGTSQDLYAVAFTPAGFVAVGDYGTVLVSSDGASWTAAQRAADVTLRGVASLAGVIAAVGDLGTVISSSDGKAWTRRSSGVQGSLNKVLAANGALHAIGDAGLYLSSTNATTWTSSTVSGGTNVDDNLQAIGVLGTTLVAGGDLGWIWVKQGSGSWANKSDSSGYRTSVAYGKDTFVAVGNGSDLVSYDGVTWSYQTVTTGSGPWNRILFSGSRFIAVGASGAVRLSDNGTTWTSGRSNTVNSLYGLAAGATGFVAVGSAGTIVASSDGLSWTTRSSPTTQVLGAVAYGRGRFVAVGYRGTIVTSADGVAWSAATSPMTASDYPMDILFDDRAGFIVVGLSGLALTSADGLTWRSLDVGTSASLYGIFRSGDLLCATGSGGAVLVSGDGVLWSQKVPVTSRALVGGTSAAGVSVLVGEYGNLLRSGAVPVVRPAITVDPAAVTLPIGARVTLTAGATGTPAPTYQWLFNGTVISGATTAVLQLSSLQNSSAGSYSVRVTNVIGSSTSASARVSVGTKVDNARLKNLSVRTSADEGNDSLILGFVVSGTSGLDRLPLLVRAIGPTLASFGLSGVVADPLLKVYQGSNVVSQNDNWGDAGGGASIASTATSVGAFQLNNGSKDSAVAANFSAGTYSAQVVPTSGKGVAMVEAYDASVGSATSRLINMSTRARSGTGEDVLIVGVVITGSNNKTLLVRGIGPTLGAFGVNDFLVDPVVRVYRGSTLLLENDDWRGWAELASIHSQVGAFPLPATSADASLAISLAPGAYTIHVLGKGGASGVAMAEIYEVP